MVELECMVRGYHVYKDIWLATDGEYLECRREPSNIHDSFAVAVLKDNVVVGHLPRKFSAVFSLFLRGGGSISCRVNGSRRYSVDLPQGGLEIPCILIISGEPSLMKKFNHIRTRVVPAITTETSTETDNKPNDDGIRLTKDDSMMPPPTKKQKGDEWLCSGLCLSMVDGETVLAGEKLNDMHMDMYQKLLKALFPDVNGLSTTLKVSIIGDWIDNFIQVFFCRGNHWFTASTIGCCTGQVKVYDSLYEIVDSASMIAIQEVFPNSDITVTVVPVQKQTGAKDCGLFALAFASFLAFRKNPELLSTYRFDQNGLRKRYLSCIDTKQALEF